MALVPQQNTPSSQPWYPPRSGYSHEPKPKRTLAVRSHTGNSNRHDQSMAKGSRFSVCQRTVGEHPLPNYGPVIFVNRPVRTRTPGGVGRGSSKLPFTRLSALFISFLRATLSSAMPFILDSLFFCQLRVPPCQVGTAAVANRGCRNHGSSRGIRWHKKSTDRTMSEQC
jgi:hypothetical protein